MFGADMSLTAVNTCRGCGRVLELLPKPFSRDIAERVSSCAAV